jgi:ATP-dependent Clp protease adapter protein ClpS
MSAAFSCLHRITMHVHQHGIGACGVFTYEVAETKVPPMIETFHASR